MFENGPLLHSPNNLNGYTAERKFGKKSVLFLRKTFSFLVFSWIWGEKVFYFWRRSYFLVFTWTRGEKVFCLHFSFGLHLISIPEQNRGRGSSTPMLKIEQNWDKIANYPSQYSTKIGTTAWYSIWLISVVEQLLLTNRSLPTRVAHCMHLSQYWSQYHYHFIFTYRKSAKKLRCFVKVGRYLVMFFVLKILQLQLALKISLSAI